MAVQVPLVDVYRMTLDQYHQMIESGGFDAGALTLTDSDSEPEPEPDVLMFERDAPRPYHPGTAALVIEVCVS
jgi:hypothetical protein